MELPKVFQNNKINVIANEQTIYNYKNNNNNNNININVKEVNKLDIKNKINRIFNSKSFVYKINVIIVLENEELEKTIIGKTNNYLISIDNELIPINKIYDIKEK